MQIKFNVMAINYYNPVRIVYSSINELGNFLVGERILFITSKGFSDRGILKSIIDNSNNSIITVFDEVKPNPGLDELDEVVSRLGNAKFDMIVGLGGGSVMDFSKAISVALKNGFKKNDFSDKFRNGLSFSVISRLPLILIPTTSGTGSEVTPFATLWDHKYKVKYSFAGDFVYPDIAFYDTKLTLTLNHSNTLYPSLDAMSHALESLWNKNSSFLTRNFAFQSLRKLNNNLILCLNNLHSIDYRKELQEASFLSGLAISQTRTAIAHAISYPFTSYFGVPHGLACSFSLFTILNHEIKNLSLDDNEYCILKDTLDLLNDLELPQKMKMYLKKGEKEVAFSKIANKERMGNYIGDSDKMLGLIYDII